MLPSKDNEEGQFSGLRPLLLSLSALHPLWFHLFTFETFINFQNIFFLSPPLTLLLICLSFHLIALYTVKKAFLYSRPKPGMSLTKLSLGGNYNVIYKLFLPRESLVSDIPAGDGNIEKLF
jgi:hypothetical protein